MTIKIITCKDKENLLKLKSIENTEDKMKGKCAIEKEICRQPK